MFFSHTGGLSRRNNKKLTLSHFPSDTFIGIFRQNVETMKAYSFLL